MSNHKGDTWEILSSKLFLISHSAEREGRTSASSRLQPALEGVRSCRLLMQHRGNKMTVKGQQKHILIPINVKSVEMLRVMFADEALLCQPS